MTRLIRFAGRSTSWIAEKNIRSERGNGGRGKSKIRYSEFYGITEVVRNDEI